jgi:hypothetical protein
VLLVLILLIGFADRIYARCAHKEQSASAPSGDGFGQPRVNFRQADALDCAMEIPLSTGGIALIDDDDYHLVAGYKWRRIWSVRAKTDYAGIRIGQSPGSRMLWMHRVILGLTDRWTLTDHRNFNGLDNRRENIRIASDSQNKFNRHKYANNRSGFKGVYFHKAVNSWVAKISFNKTQYPLGKFSSPVEAAIAYDRAAVELFGEFACLNFPILQCPFINPAC